MRCCVKCVTKLGDNKGGVDNLLISVILLKRRNVHSKPSRMMPYQERSNARKQLELAKLLRWDFILNKHYFGFSKTLIWASSLTRNNNSYCSGQVSTTITLNDCNMINSEENQNSTAATAQTGSTIVLKMAFSNLGGME